ncbi:MAG: hypothetical protein OEM28_12350 [Nitrosopumilus sp.]|nr:hypothetical protein [Nitrosopumilus sp.]
MHTKYGSLEKVGKLDNKENSIWNQTPLSDFGSKCIMNEHDICQDPKCKCFCHQKEVEYE